jgi:subtilase family serine protease
MTALSVPSALAPLVVTVTGLGEATVTPRLLPPGWPAHGAASAPAAEVESGATVPPQPGSHDGKPCSRFWDELQDRVDPPYGGGFPDPTPYITCGYTPPRLRAAYGIERAVQAGNDGSGVTIAILASFAASPTLLQDSQAYAARNDPSHPLHAGSFSAILVPGSDPSPPPPATLVQSWRQNQTIAVEAIHGMAPGARLVYVGARSDEDSDIVAALNYAIQHELGSIISNPWSSGPESMALDQAAYRVQAIHAGLRGIGLYFPSGDGGDNGPDSGAPGPTGPDFPASLPEVTAVAGTTLGIGRQNERLFETGGEVGISTLVPPAMGMTASWSPPAPGGFFFGAGGGASRVYAEPRYQKGVVPLALATQNGAPARVVPDLAITGHLATGFLLGLTQTFPDGVAYGEFTIGDTSLSAALMSGVMALAEQRHHHRIGFANPALYRAAGGTAFYDIVPGPKRAVSVVAYNNGLDDSDGVTHITATMDYAGLTIHPAPGYDDVSGLGSPQGDRFLDAIPGR